ncbi:hypothetical protein ES703_82307 [subsurface metagenome]
MDIAGSSAPGAKGDAELERKRMPLDVEWADNALRLGIRTCRAFEWSLPSQRFILIRHLLEMLKDEGYSWHFEKLESAFKRSLKDGAIYFHGHRKESRTRLRRDVKPPQRGGGSP